MRMPSLTVIMPAYCEAKNLRAAYENTTRALRRAGISDYEIVIITNTRRDGSHDGTPNIADEIVEENPRGRHIHNPAYVNLGFKFRQGVKAATKDYVTWVPGDNETVEDSIASIFGHLGEADMVISYTANKWVRRWQRRFVSRCFTILCNILFGLNLRYYNGICIYPRRILQAVPMACDNFAYMAEIIIYLVKSGVRYIEVPMEIKPTTASAAFKIRSVFEVLGTLASLFWKIHFLRKRVDLVAYI
jgi:glycosyltransferase involved in cell wall biosynthesis